MGGLLDVDEFLGHSGEFGIVLDADAREHQLLVGVFVVVHEDQTVRVVRRLRVRNRADEVRIVAELLVLRLGGLVVHVELRRAGQNRIAPADQHVGVVAVRDHVGFADAGLDLLEVEARCAFGPRPAGHEGHRAHGGRDGGEAERALHDVAARVSRGDDVADGRHAGFVHPDIIGRVGTLRSVDRIEDREFHVLPPLKSLRAMDSAAPKLYTVIGMRLSRSGSGAPNPPA